MNYFDIIPEELLIEILSFLNYDELMKLRDYFQIIQSDKFWVFKLHSERPSFKLKQYLSGTGQK
jgi:hypothetical protein